ncbi:MAG: hypothetical protein KAT20_02080 [Desulfuromonadales bacterium]|nr:hypothetical protein [Desulfuromonadales bacterium]
MKKEHLEVILEDMNSKFDLVLEGHATLDRKIDDLSCKFEERFDLIDLKFTAVDQRFTSVEANLNQRIDRVETNLNQRIDRVEANLNQRIDGVESNLSQKLDAVAADLKEHRQDTEAHHGIYKVKEG